MKTAILVCLVIVGLINLFPVLGVVSARKLESAYSISLVSPDLAILMRHRALLFGILGSFILYAAFVAVYQPAAMLMAGVSMVGFAGLVLSTSGYNAEVGKVLIVDAVGIVFLIAAVLIKYVVKDS